MSPKANNNTVVNTVSMEVGYNNNSILCFDKVKDKDKSYTDVLKKE